MTNEDRELLTALAWMCKQYISMHDDDWLDHEYIGAGENAVRLLVKHGLVSSAGRGGTWTKKGKALLDSV